MTSGPVRGTLPDPPDLVSGEVPLRVMLVLSAADKETLMQAEKKNPDWRVRERARSVLLLAQGKTCAQVAALRIWNSINSIPLVYFTLKPNLY